MSNYPYVFCLLITLCICTLDGYSMMSYKISPKRAYALFAAMTVFCLAVNSYIVINFGIPTFRNYILFTIGLPYFALILLISSDKISQTFFNFWIWINIYEVTVNFSALINDFTLKNEYFLTALRFVLFFAYFLVYNKYLKAKHRSIMKKLDVNWWIFSFIPMFFTILLTLVNYYSKGCNDTLKNYPVIITIHILMFFVYVLISYTFKTVNNSMQRENLAQSMKNQIALQKKQYEFYLQKEESERIFRHDMRHRNLILLDFLEEGDINGAKELLKREINSVEIKSEEVFCANRIVNAVIAKYRFSARQKNLEFTTEIQMPNTLCLDEPEFCIMLSNLLENSTESAKSYIKLSIKSLNRQLSVNVENDCLNPPKKDADGEYVSTKKYGSALGLKSVSEIVKNNGGFLKIDDTDGIFSVFATLRN